MRENRGAVNGRIVIDAPIALPSYDLRDVMIFLDGRTAGRTELGGNFFIGNLRAGVYTVEMDIENLPIELVPERTRFVVEVAAAAVTRIDFVVKPQFGIAGRLTDATGQSLPEVRVAVFDLEGREVGSAATDQFGLYRIDGLPVGSYTLALAPESPGADFQPPTRPIEIRDDFLFGQDLVIPR